MIAEWAADADDTTLAVLGAGAVVPCESTIRRTLQTLDADALDDAFGGWAQARTKPSPAVRRRVAVDGKTLRGFGPGGWVGPAPAGRPRPRARRGPGAGRRGSEDERDPHVRHALGPHRPSRCDRHRGRHARPTRPRRIPRRPACRALRAHGEAEPAAPVRPVSYTHLRAHETRHDLVCRLLLEHK